MPALVVIEEMRTHLVDQGLVHDNALPTSLVLPGVWLDPRDGAREPRDGENATVTLVDTGLGAPTNRQTPDIDFTFVDIIVRARKSPLAKQIHTAIFATLAPIGQVGGRKGWMMGDLRVERSERFRGWQRIQPPGDDLKTFTFTAMYLIEARRKSLAGLPYFP